MKNNNNNTEKRMDPRWQKKRFEIIERDNWMCQLCGSKNTNLDVYRKHYDSQKEPWEYPEDVLITLCGNCHITDSILRLKAEADLMITLKSIGFSTHDLIRLTVDIKTWGSRSNPKDISPEDMRKLICTIISNNEARSRAISDYNSHFIDFPQYKISPIEIQEDVHAR